VALVTPLQIDDPTPRAVFVEAENSADLAAVGQSYGPPLAATYSAAGGIGTLVIPAESHEEMRAGTLEPVPGSFTPIVIEIDLATGHATSASASGALASGQIGSSFTLQPLASDAVLGFVGPGIGPLPCTSQAQIDALCPVIPVLCGKTCTLVSGAPYDPDTGAINLVGVETQVGCDGNLCEGPFDLFTGQGDLRLTEPAAAAVPGVSAGGTVLLLASLLGAAALARRRAACALEGAARQLPAPPRD
jgi:hypothetical protein